MIGTTVGKYRILERLGRGGMGTVYKAIDETLDRVVAIKVLNPDLGDEDLLKRFRAEAISLARLNHPGIATIYELHRQGDDLLMVMEFLRGETLQKLSERLGALEPPQAAHICVQILNALSHAHASGIIHRDLKPANVMVTDTGRIKVMDFGIARMLGGEHLTHTGYMMGTPAYMAPEQVLGKEIDGRADLYSVGVLFYRLLSRELPFKADTAISMAQKQVAESPTPISTFRPDLPIACQEIIAKALEKSPADRFQTPEEFRSALLAAVTPAPLGDLPTMATPTGFDLTLPMARDRQGTSAATSTQTAATGTTSPSGSSGAPSPPGTTTTGATAVPPAERTGTSVVLGRSHLFTLAAVLVVLIAGIALLAFLALRQVRGSDQTAAVPTVQPGPVAAGPQQSPQAPTEQPTTPAPSPAPAESESTPGRGTPPPPTNPASTSGVTAADAAAKKAKAAAAKVPETAAAPATEPAAPPPAPEPPRPPPASEVAAVTFKNVKVLVKSGNEMRDRDAVLTLEGNHLAINDRSGQTNIVTLPYSAIGQAFYSRSKQPKWKGPDGKEQSASVDLGKLGFFRGDRNWLILTTQSDPVVIRLEDADLRTILPALSERAGIKIQR